MGIVCVFDLFATHYYAHDCGSILYNSTSINTCFVSDDKICESRIERSTYRIPVPSLHDDVATSNDVTRSHVIRDVNIALLNV